MARLFVLAIRFILFAGLATAGAAIARQPAGNLVFCYDEVRDLVQDVEPDDCDGRVVSEQEAAEIRTRLRRERLEIFDRSTPEEPRSRRGERTSSAFAVDGDGHFMTAFHAVDGCTGILLRAGDGRSHPAELVGGRRNGDLAVLYSELRLAPLPISARAAALDDRVATVGFPVRGLPRLQPKTVSGSIVGLAGAPEIGRLIAAAIPVYAGNSGGPLLAEDGAVVGMVVAKANTPAIFAMSGEVVRDLTYAVAAETLVDFLATHGISPLEGVDTKAAPPPEDSVARIICTP